MTELSSSFADRRAVLAMMGSVLALGACEKGDANGDTADRPQRLIDLRDRPVRVNPPVDRLTIDDGRYLIALALIHPDPVSLLSAWSGDVNRISPDMFAAFAERWPAIRQLPTTPSSADEFSVEAVLAASPGVALVSLGSGPTDAQAAQVEAAGMPVAFIDFFSHPFENQARSLSLIGRLIGRAEQADRYNRFRQQRLDAIAGRVSGIPEDRRPTVFLEAHAGNGPDCCNSPGRGNVGDYIAFVGGRNIGADVLKAPFGKLNLEYVVDRDPDVYIATGGPHLEKAGGYVVGPGFDSARSRASLTRIASRRGIASLSAVREGRFHGLSHQLINSPIDIVATEALARWIHPELFADLDPRATLDAINRDFLAVPYRGEYWTEPAPAA